MTFHTAHSVRKEAMKPARSFLLEVRREDSRSEWTPKEMSSTQISRLSSKASCPAMMYASRSWAKEKHAESVTIGSRFGVARTSSIRQKYFWRKTPEGFEKWTTRSNRPGLRR